MLAVCFGLLGALLLVADLAAADEPEVEDNPPAILGGAVSPGTLSFEGGNVQLSADVVDDFGVAMVYAQIYAPDGANQAIQLFQGDRTTYFGTLEVPPNYSDSMVSYGVEVQAYDTNNAYAATSIGEVQVEAAPQFDEAPYVSEALLTPQFLPSTGGSVTISADASDNRSISIVFATVADLGGSIEVPLQPISSSRYEGTFAAPANPGPLAAEYVVEIIAQDDIGQETRVSAGTITVEPPPPEPPPPSAGQLEARPASHSFGSVLLGREARRLVFVRNGPRRGGEPVEATARIVGSPAFSLPGAPAEGIHFSLRPGEKRAFPVEFRPTAAGEQHASLEIVRDDGGQPVLAIAVSGRAAPRGGPSVSAAARR
jgi:Abnormal spindle-like microcephaly-assoc'd, ASPM-SPD-2-Hydin